MAQLETDLAPLDPHGNFTLVHNTLLSLNNQPGMRVVYPPEFKTSLLWMSHGPGASILKCAAEKKALLSVVEALPPEEFASFDDATFDDATFDDLAHEFNLLPALPVPPEAFASFDPDDLASEFGLTPHP